MCRSGSELKICCCAVMTVKTRTSRSGLSKYSRGSVVEDLVWIWPVCGLREARISCCSTGTQLQVVVGRRFRGCPPSGSHKARTEPAYRRLSVCACVCACMHAGTPVVPLGGSLYCSKLMLLFCCNRCNSCNRWQGGKQSAFLSCSLTRKGVLRWVVRHPQCPRSHPGSAAPGQGVGTHPLRLLG